MLSLSTGATGKKSAFSENRIGRVVLCNFILRHMGASHSGTHMPAIQRRLLWNSLVWLVLLALNCAPPPPGPIPDPRKDALAFYGEWILAVNESDRPEIRVDFFASSAVRNQALDIWNKQKQVLLADPAVQSVTFSVPRWGDLEVFRPGPAKALVNSKIIIVVRLGEGRVSRTVVLQTTHWKFLPEGWRIIEISGFQFLKK